MTINRDQLFVCEQLPPKDLAHFVTFWSTQFYYPGEAIYKRNIKKPRTVEKLRELFAWKIGKRLSSTHLPLVEEQFIKRYDEAAALLKALDNCERREIAESFLDRFERGGAIYRIFWLHCCDKSFPIYDQHVHRAMTYICDGELQELDKVYRQEKKIGLYLNRYLPFFAEFKDIDGREVDQALWQFGKFLKKSQRGGDESDAAD